MLATTDPLTILAGNTYQLAKPIAPLTGQTWGCLIENRSGLLLQVTTPEGSKWLGPYMADVFRSGSELDPMDVTVRTFPPPTPFAPGAGQSYIVATWGQYPSDFASGSYPAQVQVIGETSVSPLVVLGATGPVNIPFPFTIENLSAWPAIQLYYLTVTGNCRYDLAWMDNSFAQYGGTIFGESFWSTGLAALGANIRSIVLPVRSDRLSITRTPASAGVNQSAMWAYGTTRDPSSRGMYHQWSAPLAQWSALAIGATHSETVVDYTGPARVSFHPGVNTSTITIEDRDETGAIVGSAFFDAGQVDTREVWLSPYRHVVTLTSAAGDVVSGQVIPEW